MILKFIGFGRKTLLTWFSLAISISLIAIGAFYIKKMEIPAIVFIMIFVGLFEWSLGPILWIYISETLTEKATGLAVFISLFFTIAIGLVSPVMLSKLGGNTFFIWAFFSFVTFLVFLIFMKETKGLSE